MTKMDEQKKTLPLVVYCLPIYNGADILMNCVNSILQQTYENVKILIGDNCSTDSTQDLCEDLAKNNSNIIYLRHSKNNGCYWNYLKLISSLGILQAKYFVFAQDDTIYLPNHASRCISILEKNDKVVSCMTALGVDNNPNAPVYFDDLNTTNLSLKNRIAKFARLDSKGLLFVGVHRASAFENVRDMWFNLSTNRLTDLEISTYTLVSGESIILNELLAHRSYAKTRQIRNENYNAYLERHHVASNLRQGVTIPFCNGIRKICQQIFQRSDIDDINEALDTIDTFVSIISKRYDHAIDLEINRALDLVKKGIFYQSWHPSDIENQVSPIFEDKLMSIFLNNLLRDAVDCYTFLKNDKLKQLIDLCLDKTKAP
jgi:glycosyltransferase involved in cell wall biosynthesis